MSRENRSMIFWLVQLKFWAILGAHTPSIILLRFGMSLQFKSHFTIQPKQERSMFHRKRKTKEEILEKTTIPVCVTSFWQIDLGWKEITQSANCSSAGSRAPFSCRHSKLNVCYCWKITVEIAQSPLLYDEEVAPWTFCFICLQCESVRQKARGRAATIRNANKSFIAKMLAQRSCKKAKSYNLCMSLMLLHQSSFPPTSHLCGPYYCVVFVGRLVPPLFKCNRRTLIRICSDRGHFVRIIWPVWSGAKVCAYTFTRSDTEMWFKFIPFRVVFYLLI